MKRERNSEYLFTPENSQARKDQEHLKELFAGTYFEPDRVLDLPNLARIIITSASDEKNIWRKEASEEIRNIDKIVRNITAVNEDGDSLSYQDICQKRSGTESCYENDILQILGIPGLTFPNYAFQPNPSSPPVRVFLGNTFGGVEVEEKRIKEVKHSNEVAN